MQESKYLLEGRSDDTMCNSQTVDDTVEVAREGENASSFISTDSSMQTTHAKCPPNSPTSTTERRLSSTSTVEVSTSTERPASLDAETIKAQRRAKLQIQVDRVAREKDPATSQKDTVLQVMPKYSCIEETARSSSDGTLAEERETLGSRIVRRLTERGLEHLQMNQAVSEVHTESSAPSSLHSRQVSIDSAKTTLSSESDPFDNDQVPVNVYNLLRDY